jgi:tripartite-type tricarboxylate transporter receptor subunit TctC
MDTKRLGLYPNVPTLSEATGPKWYVLTWRGVFGPKGIPQEVSDRLVPALQKAHASQQFQDFMRDRGFGVAWMGPRDAAAYMEKSYEDFGRVIKASGITK